MGSMMAVPMVSGLAGGLAGTFGCHHWRLKYDCVYRDGFEGQFADEQAQRLLPGALVAVSLANGLLTALICWAFTLPAVPVGLSTGGALFLFSWWCN